MPISFTKQRPLRVAIVGAGPAGFYSAEILLKSDVPIIVDMFEKLPAPFGLVRYGVSPDHQKIKNVIKVFEQTASAPGFSYFGNVTVGRDITVFELKKFYDVTIFCYGAEADRHLGIKGEDLKGSYKASHFVGWYNGHPQFSSCQFDFSQKTAVIIGQGNVAIDIARILCSTRDELAKTDICQHALDLLSQSKIKEVNVYGRRGAVDAAFTPAEIKEMGHLEDCSVVVDSKDLQLTEASERALEGAENIFRKKNLEILKSYQQDGSDGRSKKFILHFNRTPVEIMGQDKVGGVRFEINDEGKPSGQYEEIACGAFFTSIGYVGSALEGVPFLPEKGVVPSLKGRVLDAGAPVKGWYVCGWIAHGASGVIGTNKLRAQETVGSLMEDLAALEPCENRESAALLDLLKSRGVVPVTFIDWKKIDAYEIMMGLSLGKPREKVTQVSKMMSVSKASVDK